ncbi:hypothetical protein BDV12DRAFT_170785 [Aspergillus spectabilis]
MLSSHKCCRLQLRPDSLLTLLAAVAAALLSFFSPQGKRLETFTPLSHVTSVVAGEEHTIHRYSVHTLYIPRVAVRQIVRTRMLEYKKLGTR